VSRDESSTSSAEGASTAELRFPGAGTIFDDRYEIVGGLGSGGFAVVFRAVDRLLKREVALKILRPERTGGTAVRRLRSEARLARDVADPRLVRIFDVGEAGGLTYLVMEYVPGRSLAAAMADGAVAIDEVARIADAVLGALSALHASGVVHRDVKPSNILLAEDGAVKLCDFGLAKWFDRDESMATADGAVLGTVDYMAPEVALGEHADERSDLYSLGVVLFEMVGGAPPYRAQSSLGLLLARLHQEPPALAALRPEAPAWLPRFIAWLMARDRDRRPPSAAAARQALERREAPRARRRSRRWIAAAALLLALLASAAWAADRRGRRFAQLVHRPGEGVAAVDQRGRTMWTWSGRPPGAVTAVAHLGPGGEPMVVGADVDAEGQIRLADAALVVRDARDGREVRRVPFRGTGMFPEFEDRWGPELSIADLDGDGADEVLISCQHKLWFPSQTFVWEPRIDRMRLLFAANGHHRFAGTADLAGDGRRDILLAGINNRIGWFNALAAVRPVPAIDEPGQPFAGSSFDPMFPMGEGRTPLVWYSLLRQGRLDHSRLQVDVAAQTITIRRLDGRTLETLDFEGFAVSDSSSLAAGERGRLRSESYDELRECRRLLETEFPTEASGTCGHALELARASGDRLLVEWSTRQTAAAKLLVGDLRGALASIEAVYATSEAASEVAYGFARTAHLSGRPELAADWYRRAFARGARYDAGRGKFEILEGLVFASSELGAWDTAQADIARFAPALGDDGFADFSRAFVRWGAGRLEAADVERLSAVSLDHHRWWMLEFDLALNGPSSELLARVDALDRELPALGPYLASLRSEIWFRQGDPARAEPEARRAIAALSALTRSDTMARAVLRVSAARAERWALGSPRGSAAASALRRQVRAALAVQRSAPAGES
jgi:eukaryotic-like serine/threonine-protein kinase